MYLEVRKFKQENSKLKEETWLPIAEKLFWTILKQVLKFWV